MATTTRSRYADMTRKQLLELARERDVDDRSNMNRDQLQAALELVDTGPHAIDMLLGQHARIRSLFEQVEQLSRRPSRKKEQLVGELITILSKHGEIEEQVFYPAVRNEVEGQADEIDESMEEHHAAKYLLRDLEGMSSDAPRYDMKVHVLEEYMLHHLEEEEEDLFPAVRKALDDQRLREIGGGMVKVWDVAPSRPHPAAPQSPPANVLMGIPTAAWDLTMSALELVRRRLLRR